MALQMNDILAQSWSSLSPHIANQRTHLPRATLSTDQSNRSPGFLNFQLTNTTTWLWRWLPHRLSKRQSLKTVVLRTPVTQMIFFNHGSLTLFLAFRLLLIICYNFGKEFKRSFRCFFSFSRTVLSRIKILVIHLVTGSYITPLIH